jgi:hypothetical protein
MHLQRMHPNAQAARPHRLPDIPPEEAYKRLSEVEAEAKRRKLDLPEAYQDGLGDKQKQTKKVECDVLLDEWYTDLARGDWLQYKIYFPEFANGCTIKGNETAKKRTRSLGYRIRNGVPMDRSEFLYGYVALQERGAPLMTIKEASSRCNHDPRLGFQLLCNSLAAWDPRQGNIPPLYTKKGQKSDSLAGLLPTLDELKVLHH